MCTYNFGFLKTLYDLIDKNIEKINFKTMALINKSKQIYSVSRIIWYFSTSTFAYKKKRGGKKEKSL
jgi:hypothetical protein